MTTHIILNIGLGAPRNDDNRMSYTRRLKNAFAWIGENFKTCYLEHRHLPGEPTLVVEGMLLDADPENVYERVYELAVSVNQDCVAAVYGASKILIGPYSHKWGSFNESLFLQPTRKVSP